MGLVAGRYLRAQPRVAINRTLSVASLLDESTEDLRSFKSLRWFGTKIMEGRGTIVLIRRGIRAPISRCLDVESAFGVRER